MARKSASGICQTALAIHLTGVKGRSVTTTLIRPARKAAKLTLEELADRIDMSVSQLSRIETGKREPRLIDMLKIAKALNLNPGDLVTKKILDQVEVTPPSGSPFVSGRLDPELVEFSAQRVVRRLILQMTEKDDRERAEDAARMIVQAAAQLQRQDDEIALTQPATEREDAE